jgi:hypothetical protein
LIDEIRYFFYISNDPPSFSSTAVVFECNKRCDQENLISQLSSGVRSLCAPVDNLESNWAYMVMTSIAWTLKSWSALLLPINNAHRSKHESERDQILKMEFRTFLDQFISIPCQILENGGRVIYRLLGYRDMTPAFFRLCGRLNL